MPRIPAFLPVIVIALLLAACGGSDKPAAGDADASHGGDGGTTGGAAEVTAADLGATSTGALGPEFEGFGADTAVLAATSGALDSDEVFTALDVATPPPRPLRFLAGTDCVSRSVMSGVIEIDYAACPHAQGTISLVRQQAGTWLLKFNDGFSIYKVAIVGFLLLTRTAQGEFNMFTCDKDGGSEGTAPVSLSWQGKTAVVARDVYLIGKLLTVDQPLKYFHLSGDGFVARQGTTEKLKLGVGGAPDMAKNDPIQFPRPLDARCPHAGLIRELGLFSAAAKATVTFTVRDTPYPLAVDLGDVVLDGDFVVRFDRTQPNGIGTLGLSETGDVRVNGAVVNGPVPVTGAGVLAALGTSSLAADVKDAITSFAANHKDKLPTVPVADVVQGVMDSFKAQYLDGFCAGQ